MKIKDLQDFPEKKEVIREIVDRIYCKGIQDSILRGCGLSTRHQDVDKATEELSQALSELGELDLTEAFEKWAKENGWVNISAKGQEIIDKKLATNGYIKLSEVSLDVRELSKIMVNTIDMSEDSPDEVQIYKFALAIADSKEVVKLKEK